MAGLYIHIPFCKQACYYCDFHFSTNQSLRDELIDLIATELELQKGYLAGQALDTIYFGGGTPSLLTETNLATVFNAIVKNFTIYPDAEVTLEANPDDLTTEKIKSLKSVGVNRLSIGIQSFDDAVLKFLNRAHTAQEAFGVIEEVRQAGFDNINIDLIHSIPGQNSDQLKRNLEVLLSLEPQHISAYSLTVEEKTVFGRWAKQGKFSPVAEEQSANQFELVMDVLMANGYHHYEISNYCLPGYASKHNSSYWQQKHYLGVGPSAHSYNGHSRQFNVSSNALYKKGLLEAKIPFEFELLSEADKINEYIFTTLRLDTGCDLNYLATHFKYNLNKERAEYLAQLATQNLTVVQGNHLKLTRAGKLLADRISEDLFLLTK